MDKKSKLRDRADARRTGNENARQAATLLRAAA